MAHYSWFAGRLGHVFFNPWPWVQTISAGFKNQSQLVDIARSYMGKVERGEHMLP
jgi:hypothetical protein